MRDESVDQGKLSNNIVHMLHIQMHALFALFLCPTHPASPDVYID